jgi:hypothetical protein
MFCTCGLTFIWVKDCCRAPTTAPTEDGYAAEEDNRHYVELETGAGVIAG